MLNAVADATPEWLTAALRASGALPTGHVRTAAVTRVHDEQLYSISYFLAVTYSDDVPTTAPGRLFLKLPRPGAPAAFTAEYAGREIRMYQTLMRDQFALPVIPCYDAFFRADPPAYHLLLEDLSATHDQPAHFRLIADHYIEQTVDALADLHGYWWEGRRPTHTLVNSPVFPSLADQAVGLLDLLPDFVAAAESYLMPGDELIYERVLAAAPSLGARRSARAFQTLLHGDAHFWNFLYPRDPRAGRTYLLDWQSYHFGRAVDDLAYVVVLRYPHRTLANELELVHRYHARLLADGIRDYDWPTCWHDYRVAAVELVLFGLLMWHNDPVGAFWRSFVHPAIRAFWELRLNHVLEHVQ